MYAGCWGPVDHEERTFWERVRESGGKTWFADMGLVEIPTGFTRELFTRNLTLTSYGQIYLK